MWSFQSQSHNRYWLCFISLFVQLHLGEGKEKSNCHGWACFTPASEKQFASLLARRGGADPYACDIPVFDAEDVPSEVFMDAEVWKSKPFILRGDANTLKAQATFGKKELMKLSKEHNLKTHVGRSWDIVMNKGEGPVEMNLTEYLKKTMHDDIYDGSVLMERPYAFDRHSNLLSLPGYGFPVHPVFEAWNESAFTPSESTPILLMGGPESGVGFHRHAGAIHMTFHGWKRWFFYDPAKSPPGGVHGAWPIFDWIRHVYPTLSGDWVPMECVQRPGDIMNIPEGWYHATINLADSAAVSIQQKHVFSKPLRLEFDAKSSGDITTQTKRLHKLVKLQPDNLEAKFQLFQALQTKNPAKAGKIMAEVSNKDPFHVDAQYMLSNFLADLSRANGPKEKDDFGESLAGWKPYLENNTRSLKANHLLAQYYLLRNDKASGLHLLNRNLDLQRMGVQAPNLPNFEAMIAQVLRM